MVETHLIGDVAHDRTWDDIVRSSPGATIFQSAFWARYEAALFGARHLALLARGAGGDIKGALLVSLVPYAVERFINSELARIVAPVLRTRRVDARWLGGPLARDEEVAKRLLREAVLKARGLGAHVIGPWRPPVADSALQDWPHAWPSRDEHTFLVDLTRPREVLWASLDRSARKNVRHAQASRLTIEAATDPATLLEHHRFFVRCRREAGFKAYGFRPARFQWEILGRGHSESLAVRQGSEILAVMGLWSFAGAVHEFGLAQSRASVERRTRAADLLKWWVIETFAGTGARVYDLAGVTPGAADRTVAGIFRFKAKWGGSLRRLRVYEAVSVDRALTVLD